MPKGNVSSPVITVSGMYNFLINSASSRSLFRLNNNYSKFGVLFNMFQVLGLLGLLHKNDSHQGPICSQISKKSL